MVKVAATIFADIIEEFSLGVKNTNKRSPWGGDFHKFSRACSDYSCCQCHYFL
tara:strand:+ start:727 stop:885 length:159 start_codon:yes stop_codon:yes gene_type:complete